MPDTISRDEAIAIISEMELRKLTDEDRAEQLDTMTQEDWRVVPGWNQLAEDVRAEMESGREVDNPMDTRFDPVLMVWLCDGYAAARNEFLNDLLEKAGHDYDEVTGEPASMIPCPCCGRCTLEGQEGFDICMVCGWEDDGQDNTDANQIFGGPNQGISLTRGRINFLISGIYDPAREELREWLHPADRYVLGREFVLSSDLKSVSEPAMNWQGSLKDEQKWSR